MSVRVRTIARTYAASTETNKERAGSPPPVFSAALERYSSAAEQLQDQDDEREDEQDVDE